MNCMFDTIDESYLCVLHYIPCQNAGHLSDVYHSNFSAGLHLVSDNKFWKSCRESLDVDG